MEKEKIFITIVADGKRVGEIPLSQKKAIKKYIGLAGIEFINKMSGKKISGDEIRLLWAT